VVVGFGHALAGMETRGQPGGWPHGLEIHHALRWVPRWSFPGRGPRWHTASPHSPRDGTADGADVGRAGSIGDLDRCQTPTGIATCPWL